MAKKSKRPAKWIEAVCGSSYGENCMSPRKPGLWHWRIKSGNGEIELSNQIYRGASSKSHCFRAMRAYSKATGIPIIE